MSPIALPIAELKSALAGLGKIIAKRVTLPVLGIVRIERTSDGWIALTGTDLDHHVTVRLEQPANGEPIALLVPYEDLLKTCKAGGGGGEILVERNDDTTVLLKYRIGGQAVATKVESLPVAEFPEIPRIKADAIAIPEPLRQAIHDAMQCASTDPTRFVLNGACIDVSKPEANYVVGTDGRHLFSSNSFTLPLKESLIIPTHKFIAWKEFNNDGEWQLKVVPNESDEAPGHLQISSRRWRFISRQIDGNYPNWRQVIPDAGGFTTTIEFEDDIDAVLQTIARMPCHDEVNFTIGLEYTSGKLAFLGRPSGAENWTRIELAGAKARGKDVKIFVNRNFLAKALQFGLTKIETTDAMSPMRICDGGRQMIIMPVRSETVPEPAPASPSPSSDSATPANNPPPSAEQPKEKSMSNTNGADQGASKTSATTTTDTTEKSALENALAQLEVVRGDFRNAFAGLNKFGDLLKQAHRENKASEKEISSVRATLRSLQAVRI